MGRILSFEMMRGIAAIAVVAFHCEGQVTRGYLAVDLFFCLSGFVLFRAYASRLGNFKQFLIFTFRRFVRLYPLMFLGGFIGVILHDGSPLEMLMIPPGGTFLYPTNVPLWSLAFEMIASILFAGLFRYGKAVWWMIWLASAIAFGIAISAFGSANIGARSDEWLFGLFRIGLSFSTGIGLSYICRWEARPTAWATIICFIPLLLLIIPDGPVFVDYLAIYSIFPSLVVLTSFYDVKTPGLAIFLGSSSYAVYAIHFPIVTLFFGLGKNWLYLPIIAAIVILGWVLERVYDRPIRQYVTSRLGMG